MRGYFFSKFDESGDGKTAFDKLMELFMQLLTYTSGDVGEALQWLNELDRQFELTSPEYGMGDFIDDLKDKGYIDENKQTGEIKITPKTEQGIRKKSLEEIFGKLKKTKQGDHNTRKPGQGDEISPDSRPYQFGDMLEQIDFTESIRNAQINHGLDSFSMQEDDLQIRETDFKSQTSTVLMIDISHSMILYGEDRITPAKKVAMALSELITTKYPKDTLDIVVFGNDAWPVEIKDLPYLQVGPYHTNTVAGLELAMDTLRRRRNPNKQIFMITDGKPTCLKVGKKYYKNSFGLDRKITSRCLNLAAQCKKLKIPITTFMIASDPYLQRFVNEFTETNNGKAFFASLDQLGAFIFKDFDSGKR
ncbi:MAG: VWA domain-containing protein, partial [Bacteroidota bacterium]